MASTRFDSPIEHARSFFVEEERRPPPSSSPLISSPLLAPLIISCAAPVATCRLIKSNIDERKFVS